MEAAFFHCAKPKCLSTTNGCNMHCSKRGFVWFWHLPIIADSSPTSLIIEITGASMPFWTALPTWCKWSVQKHTKPSGFRFRSLLGVKPFSCCPFFDSAPYWPALGDCKAMQGHCFCGFNGRLEIQEAHVQMQHVLYISAWKLVGIDVQSLDWYTPEN